MAFETLGAEFFHKASGEGRNLDFQFANWGGVLIEQVSSCDPRVPSAVTKMVAKQPCTPYHVCLEVHDLNAEIKSLKHNGFRQMGEILTSDVYGYEAEGVFLFGREIGVV